MSKKKTRWFIILLIILEIFLLVYLGGRKEGYHLDEIFSYGLSNSYYTPFLRNIDNWRDNWTGNEIFKDYITVNRNDAFCFNSVFYNQLEDAHPPLFYCMLHLVCSLSQGIFSKWQGLILNFVLLLLTLTALYYMSKNIFNNQWEALLVVAIYGLSAGAFSTALYIRMYMFLTFLCVCDGVVHIRLRDKNTWINLLPLYLVTMIGFLVQYYFIIAAFFVSAVYSLEMIFTKKYKDFLTYAAIRFCGILIGILIFPGSLKHIFRSYRGREAIQNFSNMEDFIQNVKAYMEIYEKQIFSKQSMALLALVCILIITIKLIKTKKREIICPKLSVALSERNMKIMMLSFCAIMYSIVIAKIAPYRTDRYVFCVYPYWIIMLYGIIKTILSFLLKKTKMAILLTLILFLYGNGVNFQNVGYIQQQAKEENELLKQYSDNNALCVFDEDWKATELVVRMTKMPKTYLTDKMTLEKRTDEQLKNIVGGGYNSEGEILVFESKAFESEEIITFLKNSSAIHKSEKLFDTGYFRVYICNK